MSPEHQLCIWCLKRLAVNNSNFREAEKKLSICVDSVMSSDLCSQLIFPEVHEDRSGSHTFLKTSKYARTGMQKMIKIP